MRKSIPVIISRPRATTRLLPMPRPRLNGLGDTCVNNSAAAASATAKATPVVATSKAASTAINLAPRAQLRGFGLLPPGVTGKGGASGAASGAAAGASIGSSIFPGIGTAIGAIIGAVAGGLIHTSQYGSWLATDTNIINVLKNIPAGFQGRTLPRQTPTATAPLTLEMIWTAIVVTGNMYSYVSPNPGHSPSDMQNEFDWVMAWMLSILKCMNSNPVGANLTVTCNVGNNVTFHLTFVNPGLANTNTVTQTVIIPAYLAWCTHNNTVDTQSTHCPADAKNPLNQLVLDLMTDYQIAQVNPAAGQAPAAAVVTPGKTATATVTSPAGSTTVKAGTASSVPASITGATASTQPVTTLYWLSNGNLGTGTVMPAGAIPLTAAQYSLMATQPSSAAAQALYDSLMGFTPPAAAATDNDTAPIASVQPNITVNVPASTPASVQSGLPLWVYVLLGGGALYVLTQKK